MQESLVTIDNVSFRYKEELVLDRINLEIKKGEFLGIIGPNGSGKTTLLKIILGLLRSNTGSVSLFGTDIHSFTDWSKIGYVPQKAGLATLAFPITVREVVAMGRVNTTRWFDFSSQEDERAIDGALEAVAMEQYGNRLVTELSGGQQQRVFIARALCSKPELLILDEPTVGVDVDSQAKFYQLLRELNTNVDLTLILVSHDVDVVAHEVNTLACINCKLVCHGKPQDVLKEDFMQKVYGKDLRFVIHGH